MSVTLGAGWLAKPDQPLPVSPVDERLDALLMAVSALSDRLLSLPAPRVMVEPQDLTEIVTAVQGLAGPRSVDPVEIAQAIRDVIAPALVHDSAAETNLLFAKLLEALDKLDFRMKGSGIVSRGGSSAVTVENKTGTSLSVVPQGVVDIGADFSMFSGMHVNEVTDFISVVFDTVASMNTHTVSLAANGGSETVTSSNLVVSSGTSATGTAGRRSKSNIIYSPGHEGRASFTTVFGTSTAGCKQQVGLISEDGMNGAYLEDDGTGFYIVHMRNGFENHKLSSADWNGNVATNYTLNGAVIPLDLLTGRVWRIRFGYLGYAGIIYEVRSPDGKWCVVHTIKYESETVPLFTETNLPLAAKVTKTSGTSNVTLKSASWQGAVFGASKTPLISDENSTTTALGSSGTFTGGWVSHEGYTSIELTITTDQVSASSGILVQFSDRGDSGAVVQSVRTDSFNAADVTAGFKTVIVEPRLSFTKVIYMNGGVAQGSLFLQTRFHKAPLELPRTSLESDVSATNVATMSRNVVLAKNDGGTYGNITRSTIAGAFRVSIAEAEVSVPIRALTTWTTGQASVSSSSTPVVAISSPMTGRKTFAVKALAGNSQTVYVGPSASLTTGNGYPLSANEVVVVEVDETAALYILGATSATQSVAWIQVG